MQLRSRGLAITAAILALIASPGNIIGLPMGIWALVVLSRREVIEAFKASQRDKTIRKSRTALLIGFVVVLGGVLVGAGVIIYSQGQQNLEMPKALADPQRDTTTQPTEDWKITLPSGVTVEMIGVSENPSDGKQWWRPDGSPLAQRPYSHLRASMSPGANERGNEFAVRLANLPKDGVGTRWEFDPSTSYGGGGQVFEAGDAIPQLRAVAAITSTSQDVITVKLGVAAGPWITLAESSSRGSSSGGRGNAAVSFSPTHEEDTAVVVTVAHNVEDRDVRVIAVDNGGKELTPGRSATGTAGNVRQLTCTFHNVRLSEIKEFRLQARPYEWAVFKNVSLMPRNNKPLTPGPPRHAHAESNFLSVHVR
jgi:hypothetical protein